MTQTGNDYPDELKELYNHTQNEDWEEWQIKRNVETTSRNPTWKRSLNRTDYYKVVKLYVKDLLKSTKEDDHFKCRNISFIYTQICGTIVSKTLHKGKISLQVHDGSGSMTCLLEENYFKKRNQDNFQYLMKYSPEDQNLISRATLMTCSSLKHLSQSLPSTTEDLKVGDIVLLEGKLSEYNQQIYLFIEKIAVRTVADLIANLEYQEDFYENWLK